MLRSQAARVLVDICPFRDRQRGLSALLTRTFMQVPSKAPIQPQDESDITIKLSLEPHHLKILLIFGQNVLYLKMFPPMINTTIRNWFRLWQENGMNSKNCFQHKMNIMRYCFPGTLKIKTRWTNFLVVCQDQCFKNRTGKRTVVAIGSRFNWSNRSNHWLNRNIVAIIYLLHKNIYNVFLYKIELKIMNSKYLSQRNTYVTLLIEYKSMSLV